MKPTSLMVAAIGGAPGPAGRVPRRSTGQDAATVTKPTSATARAASVVASSLMAFAVSGCGLSGPAHAPPASNAAAVVDMGFESYSSADVTVHAGDTVEWRNTSLITHTVTDDPRRAKRPGDAGLPPGAQSFDSGDIAAGQVYTRAFTIPGNYRYFCAHHEKDGMVGTVVVKPAP